MIKTRNCKTNWKYIFIVATSAFLAIGGVLNYLKHFEKEISSLAELPTIKKEEKIRKKITWKVYVNTKYGFEFKYPAEYDLFEECKLKEEQNAIQLGDNLIIEIVDSKGLSLLQYTEKLKSELEKEVGVKEFLTSRKMVDGKEGIEIAYSYGPRYSRTTCLLNRNKIIKITLHAGLPCYVSAFSDKVKENLPSEFEIYEQLPYLFRFYP
jgi:hypothetical protein